MDAVPRDPGSPERAGRRKTSTIRWRSRAPGKKPHDPIVAISLDSDSRTAPGANEMPTLDPCGFTASRNSTDSFIVSRVDSGPRRPALIPRRHAGEPDRRPPKAADARDRASVPKQCSAAVTDRRAPQADDRRTPRSVRMRQRRMRHRRSGRSGPASAEADHRASVRGLGVSGVGRLTDVRSRESRAGPASPAELPAFVRTAALPRREADDDPLHAPGQRQLRPFPRRTEAG
jgi:hypothetical protein